MEILSNLNWEIFGIIVLILIFGGFIWRVAKRLFVLVVIAGLVLFGLYKFSPETLHNWFGEDNVNKVENYVEDKKEELQEDSKAFADDTLDKLENNE